MMHYSQNVADSPIVVFGSCNKEDILFSENEIIFGNKHSVIVKEHFGGSGINYTLRLLAAGYDVVPILPIGDDQIGNEIRNKLITCARKHSVSRIVKVFIESDNFFASNIKTSSSTIVVHGLKRTVFSQKPIGGEHFKKHITKRINDLKIMLNRVPNIILIGHIHSDSGDYINTKPGECTKLIIDTYKDEPLAETTPIDRAVLYNVP